MSSFLLATLATLDHPTFWGLRPVTKKTSTSGSAKLRMAMSSQSIPQQGIPRREGQGCATTTCMFLAAAVQLTSTSDEEANWQSARSLIERAAGHGARFVATPENTNYLGPHD